MQPDNVTSKTNEAVRKWCAAAKNVERIERSLAAAKDNLDVAASELGDWLTPKDSKVGEAFTIWYADGLLTVKHECTKIAPWKEGRPVILDDAEAKKLQPLETQRHYSISWRTRPSAKAACDSDLQL